MFGVGGSTATVAEDWGGSGSVGHGEYRRTEGEMEQICGQKLSRQFSRAVNLGVQEKNYFADQIPPQSSNDSEQRDQGPVVVPRKAHY